MEPKPKAKILFLDDDKFILNVYGMKFTHAGYELRTAASVEDALNELRKGFRPDVIISDLVMAQASGFDFLDTLKTEHLAQGAYRIVLTNQEGTLDKVQTQELGVDRYIVKVTMTPDEVVAAVDQVVTDRKTIKK